VTSQPAVSQTLQKFRPRVIFHCACTYSLALPTPTFHAINFTGTQNILSAAQAVGSVKALFYHSSSSVIEDGTTSLLNATEAYPILYAPEQKFPYPPSKALAERLVLQANGEHGIRTASIRPAGTFGEADTEMMEKLVQNARDGRAGTQMGEGENVYDFLYVENLVHAHLLAASFLLKGGQGRDGSRVGGEAFQITNDEPWLFWEFSRAVAKGVGCEVRKEDVKVVPVRLGMLTAFLAEWLVWIVSGGKRQSGITRFGVRYSTISRTFDIAKTKRVLGYRPVYSMEEGLERSVKWFRDQE
jgi:sterol-4alpha-carboxylate 3-dehydrogenase (decarboxylating)